MAMTSDIQQIVETARRLRQVRNASRRFLALWAADSVVQQPLDRLVSDLQQQNDCEAIEMNDSPHRGIFE